MTMTLSNLPSRSAQSPGRYDSMLLTEQQELQLARAARDGDEAAFARLVQAHLPLAGSIARGFRSHGVAFEELWSEALLGLVKAARCFDPERGVRFASYAALWIRAYLRRFTLENRRIVRGPSTRNARKVLAGLRRTERDLEHRTGERPDAEAVAAELQVAAHDVEEARAVLGGRDVTTADTAGAWRELPCSAPSPEALARDAESNRLAAELVGGALGALEPRKRSVLVRRCLSPAEVTLTELGKEMRVSRERVRQLELLARDELRTAVRRALSARRLKTDELWAAA